LPPAIPLNGPFGLALDVKGNLWVANLYDNNILEFNPSDELQSKATITEGINAPIAVAFDPAGNLWVANRQPINGAAAGSITMYTNGVQNTAATITNMVDSPTALAVDGVGNLWVANDGIYLAIYGTLTPDGLPTTRIRSLTASDFSILGVHGLTVSSTAFAFGADRPGTLIGASQWFLMSGNFKDLEAPSGDSGAALTTAADGDIYIANYNGTVNVYKPTTNVESPFLTLNFVPSGIVVDSVRGRVYISDGDPGTSIFVFSLAGTLLHTIQ
jgi:DNA-binding beta-propeller fold protein YncE